MARHRINPRLVKIHLSYTVDEAARRLKTHKNTIRNWIKLGLPVIDGRRPALVHGRDLAALSTSGANPASRHARQGIFIA
jgi:hypothetical protein